MVLRSFTCRAGFVLAAVLVSSCVPDLRFVTPEYEGKPIPRATLSVARIGAPRLRIANLDDVADDLGGASEATFRQFFENEMMAELSRLGTFRTVWFDTMTASTVLKPATLKMNEKTALTMDLPNPGEALIMDSAQADFSLIIGFLDVSRFGGSSGTMMMGAGGQMMMSGGESAALEFHTDYVVWDNRKGAVVAYGRLEQRTPFFMAMTTSTWSQAVTNLARAILTKSPFNNPSPAYKSSRQKK